MPTTTPDLAKLRTALTDAGHTAAGFATLAAKKAIEARADLLERAKRIDAALDPRVKARLDEARSRTLTVIDRVDEARVAVERKVEPVVDRVTARLPEPARKVAGDLRTLRHTAEERTSALVRQAITLETATVAKATAAKATVKKAAAKATTKTAAKKTTKKAVAEKAAVAQA